MLIDERNARLTLGTALAERWATHTRWGVWTEKGMLMRALRVSLLLGLALTVGCAGQRGLRPGAATALITIGALTTVVGVLVSAGCPDLSEDTGCGTGPSDPNLAAGIPMVAAGATMVAIGAAQRSRKTRTVQSSVPKPVMPDPFVKPLSSL